MIEVFRPGTSHIVNGITCERDTVNEFGFEHLLKTGWYLTPEECYPKEAPKTADSKVTTQVKSASSGNLRAKTLSKTTAKTAVK